MKNMKRVLKTVAFLFIFGFLASILINYGLNVDAAESKYIEIVSGTGKNLGDEVRIGDEHFYILSNNGNEIQMLAKYNVDISVMCTYNYQSDSKFDAESKIDKENQPGYAPMCGNRKDYTSLQDESISGIQDPKTGDIIGVPFSTDARHGEDVLDYEGSVIEIYVNEYVEALNTKYDIEVTGDLLDNGMFSKLFYNVKMDSLPENIKKLVNVTSWTKVGATDGNIMIIDAADQKYYSFPRTNFTGVRPVITAPASALNEKEIESSCRGSFCFKDNDEDGKVTISDEICIRDECFYVLSNSNDEVKMLAKYNLNTGLDCIASTHSKSIQSSLNGLQCEAIPSAELRQNINARGYITLNKDSMKSYGGVVYNENASLVEKYVEYINSLVDVEFYGTLVTIDDISEAIGENFSDYVIENKVSTHQNTGSSLIEFPERENTSISNYYYLYQINALPDWIYANSYWTNTSIGTDVYAVTSDGFLADFPVETTGEFGVRPLLVISTSDVPSPDNVAKKDYSACYVCSDELVWTDDPDASSCVLNPDITEENKCVVSPQMGIKKNQILFLSIMSIVAIAIALISKHNRFKRI